MSTRAIVIDADKTDLLVRVATPEELRLFTLGDAVDVLKQAGRGLYTISEAAHKLAEDGFEMRQAPNLMQWAVSTRGGRGPDHVAAVLRTKCGCEKRMVVARPWPRQIRVPLAPSMACWAGGPNELQFGTRDFVMRKHMQDEQGALWLEYEEEG